MVLPKPIKNCFNISLFNAAKEITKALQRSSFFSRRSHFLLRIVLDSFETEVGRCSIHEPKNSLRPLHVVGAGHYKERTHERCRSQQQAGENRFSDRVQALVQLHDIALANALCDGVAIHGGGRTTRFMVEPPPDITRLRVRPAR